MKTLRTAAGALVLLVLSSSSHAAQRELLTKAGEAGTLAFDQLSGFRMSSGGSFGYAAPIGFSYQSAHYGGVDGSASLTQKSTTLYVAPSLDVFVSDQVSLGGVVQVDWQKQSLDEVPAGGGASSKTSYPGTLGLTVLPRLGYLLRIGDRVAIWPRAGVGYGMRQVALDSASVLTTRSLLIDLDVGLLYRIDETFFLRVAPELTLSPAGSAKTSGPASTHATSLAFTSTVGIGVFWDP